MQREGRLVNDLMSHVVENSRLFKESVSFNTAFVGSQEAFIHLRDGIFG